MARSTPFATEKRRLTRALLPWLVASSLLACSREPAPPSQIAEPTDEVRSAIFAVG